MIHIVFAPDDNYVMQTVVAMTSLLENTRDEVTIHVLYLENHLTKENILKLQSTVCFYNAQFEEVPVNESLIKGFPILRHGPAAYLRILAPYVLPDINKILYIDGDVIVDKSIAELYDIDVSKYEFAAVGDLVYVVDEDYLQSIGFKSGRVYINTGVLLMNLKRLREIDILTKVQSYVVMYWKSIRYSDQDLLNCTCDNVLILPPKFNSIIHLWNKNVQHCRKLWSDSEIEEAKENPVIIHYLGGLKPWKYEIPHPFKNKWYVYLDKTIFEGWRPPKTIRKIFSKYKSMLLYRFK